MNPFQMKAMPIDRTFQNWCQMYPKAYDKNETDPHTKCRIILMNGPEFEAVWFSHQFQRHCPNNDLRRDLALIRRSRTATAEKDFQLKTDRRKHAGIHHQL